MGKPGLKSTSSFEVTSSVKDRVPMRTGRREQSALRAECGVGKGVGGGVFREACTEEVCLTWPLKGE